MHADGIEGFFDATMAAMSVDPFADVVGHQAVTGLLRRALERPHHAYLLIGGDGLGAHAIAERFVRTLLNHPQGRSLSAHPDAVVLAREQGEGSKSQISIEAVRAARERMMQRPVMAPRVVAYLPDADRLNDAGANALLKILEEPPAEAVFVLVAEDISRLPATIKSRAATFTLSPVPVAEIDAWLSSRGVASADRAAAIRAASGRPGRALRWLEDADERLAGAEAARTADAVLSARSPGAAVAALDADARHAEAGDDAVVSWQALLDRLMHAVRDRWEDQPMTSLAFGQALTVARRRAGGPVSPRVWLELELLKRM
jgi:DNA polymerase-3 subunit delta'